ncbi:MAG: hypothetical protein AVDCRST_MAG37-1560, partial [uncultured Rubrobacteraceae bacterium]
ETGYGPPGKGMAHPGRGAGDARDRKDKDLLDARTRAAGYSNRPCRTSGQERCGALPRREPVL